MAGDPYWADVAVLLHCDGANGASVFIDSSLNGWPITHAAGTPTTSTADAKFGTAGVLFDNPEDLVVGAAGDWSWLHSPGEKWTYEAFVKMPTSAANRALFSTAGGNASQRGVYVGLTAARRIECWFYRAAGSAYGFTALSTLALPTDSDFHHIVAQLDDTLASGQLQFFIDGQPAGTFNRVNPLVTGAPGYPLRIAGWNAGSNQAPFRGAMDEIRLTRGVARYSGTFTPPTEAFPEVGDGSTIVVATGLDAAPTFGVPVAVADQVEQATGLDASARFGDPVAIPDQVEQAVGFSAAPEFGIAMGNGPRAVQASGFAVPTVFGSPHTVIHQVVEASGWTAAPTFGAPAAARVCVAETIDQAVLFGTPYVTEPRAVQATGFSSTRVGTPRPPIRLNPRRSSGARHVHAYGLRSAVHFGTPTA